MGIAARVARGCSWTGNAFPAAILCALAFGPGAPAQDAWDPDAPGVVINEIHADPPDNANREEFIELHNAGPAPVDVSGWFFSSGVRYTFAPGTTIAPGGYLVVAEDLAAFAAAFGKTAEAGPYVGRLDGDGERLTLRNAFGYLVDEVDFSVGFPWPLASAGEGSSMELIHPSLDNDLGGSWRASGYVSADLSSPQALLPAASPSWRYRKGASEASEPMDAWRWPSFVEDGSWATGRTPIGYGDDDDNTVLTDMQGGYSSVYLRHAFEVADPAALPRPLRLMAYVDDGCVVWINGREVARLHVDSGELPYDARAQSREAEWEEVVLGDPSESLRQGSNLIAIHAINATINSTDFSIDAELIAGGGSGPSPGPPTPGGRNSVYSENAPPQVRQVANLPGRPISGQPFLVRAKVTDPDGVTSVRLRYQVVPPGSYVPAYLPHSISVLLADPFRPREKNPAFEAPAAWTEIEMRDDGLAGDSLAGDDIYTAIVPAQANRTLVRYRIAVGDTAGENVVLPYPDDPSLNFACFVYDGVPGYETTARTVHPEGVGHVYPPNVMQSLAVYFLITRAEDVIECVAANPSFQIPQGTQARFIENWEGAFVHDDEVYDHITYRLRGANGRYQIPPGNPSTVSGKRHWRFKFNKGNHLLVRDRFGNRLPTRWRVLNTGRMFGNRLDGNWGLGDQVNDIIWDAYGIPAPHGHAFHFRVVDGPAEAPTGSDGQYLGDFWGIARAFENYDVRFLEAHGLPKGNLYKLVNQTKSWQEQLRYQAPWAVSDGSDHNNIEFSLRPTQSDAWLLAHVNYDAWYRYHAVCQAIRHYDYWPDANKNATWYFEPVYTPQNRNLGLMWTLPFDADATWGPTWNAGQDRPYDAIYGSPGKPEFQKAYRARIREVRDLLWQRDQLEIVIRQTASFMDALEEPDIDRWRDATAAAGRQYFPGPKESRLEGKIKDMLDFAFVGGSWPGGDVGAGGRAAFLDSFADNLDRAYLPATPTASYVGPAGYPADRLGFRSSAFSDPQGGGTFRAMEWRLAQVTRIEGAGTLPLSDPVWKAGPVRLEIAAAWESGEIAPFAADVTIPQERVRPGARYRARVRMQDDTDRWSHWSSPVEFVAGPPVDPHPAESSLRVTEIMYHPPEGSDLEFIEVCNFGDSSVSLEAMRFTAGIDFSFDSFDAFDGSEAASLGPGECVVVAGNLPAFAARYGTDGILVAGQYSGNLSDGGERITLSFGERPILDLEYRDSWHPVTDGAGYSLEIVDPLAPPSTWSTAGAWQASAVPGGTPGVPPGGGPGPGGLQLPGDVNQDSVLDISDPMSLLLLLFLGSSTPLPCEGESPTEGGNLTLLDASGDSRVDISDAVYLLGWLFRGGPPPALGTGCVRIPGCPSVCGRW